MALAEKVRSIVEQNDFVHQGASIPLTISAGVATVEKDICEVEVLISQADRKLYEAKGQGRNRVVG